FLGSPWQSAGRGLSQTGCQPTITITNHIHTSTTTHTNKQKINSPIPDCFTST
ncbi:hypothetical protein HN011_005943, partial [Eciton burchellii]